MDSCSCGAIASLTKNAFAAATRFFVALCGGGHCNAEIYLSAGSITLAGAVRGIRKAIVHSLRKASIDIQPHPAGSLPDAG